MSMSSSSVEFNSVGAVPIKALVYHDMAVPPLSNILSKTAQGGTLENEAGRRRAEVELSQDEFHERVTAERADATIQAEARLRQEYEL